MVKERLVIWFLALVAAAGLPVTVYFVRSKYQSTYQIVETDSYRFSDDQPAASRPVFSDATTDESQGSTTTSDLVEETNYPVSHLSDIRDGKVYNFSKADLHRRYAFSSDSPIDVLVFLHMQKTGGTTFGKNLITNLDVRNPCQCPKGAVLLRCPCYASDGKRQWLYSRYSTGWMCGLHADYTEWNECLAEGQADRIEGFHRVRRYLMLTMVREPRLRFVSEWMHTNRGATWSRSTLSCNGHTPTLDELPLCYENDTWEGVTLPDFLDCPHNLAHNRQTRMLANLSLVNCYDSTNIDDPVRKQTMLKSAKENLKRLAFFGIKEYLDETQYLFEETFGVKFKTDISKLKPKNVHSTAEYFDALTPDIKLLIEQRNDLDIELYQFALQLFRKRYEYSRAIDHNIT